MAYAPATGTATVVLGDVAGSTRLWQQHPDAMTDASRRLAALLDELAARHAGHRPREQGEGDNLVAVFPVAADAAAFALAVDAALAAEPWPAGLDVGMRLGIHTGDVTFDEHTGYLGPTFNRCARLRDLGHARMVLLSQTTRDIIGDLLPAGARIEDLGVHQLRDLSRDEHVFQLRAGDDDRAYAPLKSVSSLPNNLPVPVDTLVGRDEDIRRVAVALLDHRLVTLTGPGGSGKTRLAQHVAAQVLSYATDGAWWVDLMPVQEEERVAAAIGDAAAVPEVGTGRAALLTLAAGLGDRNLLLVLDNCEHLIDAVADVVEVLLARCPSLRIVATSREMLDVAGEHALRVRPLDAGDAEHPSLDELRARPATALFLDRATMLDASSLDADARRAVVAVCRRLDGMPLAIELAAARTRALSVQDIEAGLDDRFSLLTAGGRRRRGSSRQRTLEASIAWSWDLLEDDEAAMLARLSVFPAAFDLDGAIAVGALGAGGATALDLLTALVDKSLIAVRPADDGARYRLLESIRHYGLDRLAELGETDAARDAHLDVTLAWLAGRSRSLEGVTQYPPTVADDIRTASAWAIAQGRPNELVDLYWPTFVTRTMAGTYHEAVVALQQVLGHEALDVLHDARAHSLLIAYLSTANRQLDAEALTERGLQLARACGDDFVVHATVTGVLNARAWLGIDCADLARESVTRARSFEPERGEGPVVQVAPYATLGLCYSGAEQEAYDVAVAGMEAAYRVGFGHFEALAASYAAGMNSRLARPMAEHRQLMARAVAAVPDGSPRLHTAISVIPGVYACAGTTDDATIDGWLAHAETHAGPPGSVTHAMLLAARAIATLQQHDDAVAAVPLARAAYAAMLRSQSRWWQLVAGATLAMALSDAGDVDAASSVVDDLHDQLASVPPHCLALVRTAVATAASAVLLADSRPTLTVEAIATLLRWSDRAGFAGISNLGLALVPALAHLGEPAAAAQLLGWMEATLTAGDRAWYGRQRRLYDEGTAQLAEALGDEELARRRAQGAAESLGTFAAALGGTTDEATDADRPVSGWAALTPAEVEVARQVAEGLTNKQVGEALFVSENTVKTHLKNVYAKLDIGSRAELAVAVTEAAL